MNGDDKSKSLANQRLADAFARVQTWQPDRAKAKALKSRLAGLGVELRTQGLVLVLAALQKENLNEGGKQVYDALQAWLGGPYLKRLGVPALQTKEKSPHALIEYCVQLDRTSYRHLQIEAMNYVADLKRFARIMLGDGKVG
jgi:hypothetical protein